MLPYRENIPQNLVFLNVRKRKKKELIFIDNCWNDTMNNNRSKNISFLFFSFRELRKFYSSPPLLERFSFSCGKIQFNSIELGTGKRSRRINLNETRDSRGIVGILRGLVKGLIENGDGSVERRVWNCRGCKWIVGNSRTRVRTRQTLLVLGGDTRHALRR